MSKVVQVDGERVLINKDDGQVVSVRIYDLNFTPTVGDDVEILNNNGSVLVTKKVDQVINNPTISNLVANNQVVSNPVVNNQVVSNDNQSSAEPNVMVVYTDNSNGMIILLAVSLILSIVACFLPIISISVFGLSYSMNYVYNNGRFADGVFIVIVQIIAIIMMSRKSWKVLLGLEIGAFCLFGYELYQLIHNISELSSMVDYSIFDLLGVGCYLLVISLIGSLVLSYLIKKPN